MSDQDGRVVLRQRINWISGWLSSVSLLILVIGISDPLGAHSPSNGDDRGVNASNLASVGFLMLLSLASFTIFARPRVELDERVVILRNVVHDVVIQLTSIADVDDLGAKHVRLLVGEKWFSAWCLERSNAAVMAHRGGVSPQIEATLDRLRPMEGQSDIAEGPTVRLRRPETVERSLVTIWLSYLALALIKPYV